MANKVSDVNGIYLMNFLFDLNLNQTGAEPNGQFLEEPLTSTPMPELERSRNWLILDGTHRGDLDTFTANGKRWEDYGDISNSTLVIRPHAPMEDGTKVGSSVLIRVALGPGQSLKWKTEEMTVELAICFGNADPARQELASPFKEMPPPNGVVRTTFHWDPIPPNQPDGSWCFDIGEVLEWPKKKNRLHRYGFALGIRVHTASGSLDFSMDPEMDVSI